MKVIRAAIIAWMLLVSCVAFASSASADAPAWMHAAATAPLPAHDEKTDAVLLYAEDVTTVQPNGKIKNLRRRVFKILRPDGRWYGMVHAYFDSETKVTGMRGWCIPASGKDYEIRDKEAIEASPTDIENGALATDFRIKYMRIPASDPGNVVGYEVEQEDRPYVFEVDWDPQENIPVREARYTLQLPPGWEYRAVWVNHAEVAPTISGNQHQWVMTDLPAVRFEPDMPPWRGVATRMVVALFPPTGGAQSKGFGTWRDMGLWYADLTRGRRDASAEIKQKVGQLTSASQTQEDKIHALANFMQRDIRYVGIWLGIGGWQPHSATDVFSHSFGDCKDKATLLSSMLHEIGVESYYVLINTERGMVTKDMPPQKHFNHAILAIQLPKGTKDSSLVAIREHPTLGPILFFDPTDLTTPFGQLRGALQANFGLLVGPEGGELVELPQLPTTMNGVRRAGKFSLSPNGTLFGDVSEIRMGDRAREQRRALLNVAKDADRIKPIETLLASSLSSFQITKASVANLKQNDLALGFDYSLVANSYAKAAGDLLLVRPRFIGNKSSDLLETKEPRKYPVEFDGPSRDVDTFEITLPAGYEVDDLPPPVNADYSFASYHSKTEVNGNTLKYTRTFEVKELSVPLSKVEDLKKLYRAIAGDERNAAVLKPAAH
jgi:transglutaminase-like putative cysteine protease